MIAVGGFLIAVNYEVNKTIQLLYLYRNFWTWNDLENDMN